jgi:hypothetical protein
VLDEPSLDVRHNLVEWPSAGFMAEQVAEAELGRGGEFTRGSNSSSSEVRKSPEGLTRGRARRRLHPWDGLYFGRGRDSAPEG